MQKQLRQHKNQVWPLTGQYRVTKTIPTWTQFILSGMNLVWVSTFLLFQQTKWPCCWALCKMLTYRNLRPGKTNMPTARGTQLRGSVGAPEGEKSVEKDFWSSGGLALSHKEWKVAKVTLDKRNAKSEAHKVWNSSVFRGMMELIEDCPSIV